MYKHIARSKDLGLDFLRRRVNLLLEGLSLLSGLFIDRKASVVNEGSNLAFDGIQVFREVAHDNATALTLGKALGARLLAALPLAPVSDPDAKDANRKCNDRGQDRQTNLLLREHDGETQEEKWDGKEHDRNVEKGEATPQAGRPTKLTSSVHRDTAHEGDREEDDDTRDVEEQVRKGDLESLSTRGDHGRHDGRHGGTNVGSEGQRVHLLKTQDTHADEGRQGRCSDTARLDNNGDTGTNDDCDVTVNIRGLVNDTRRHAQKHLLEDGNEDEQADEEDAASKNRKSEKVVHEPGGPSP